MSFARATPRLVPRTPLRRTTLHKISAWPGATPVYNSLSMTHPESAE